MSGFRRYSPKQASKQASGCREATNSLEVVSETRATPLQDGEKVLVAEWRRNSRGDVIRVHIENYNGYDVVCLRSWYRAKDGSGMMLPSRDGVNVSIRNLPMLADAFAKAFRVANNMGMEIVPVDSNDSGNGDPM